MMQIFKLSTVVYYRCVSFLTFVFPEGNNFLILFYLLSFLCTHQ